MDLLGTTGFLHGTTTRGCGIENVNRKSNCTWSTIYEFPIGPIGVIPIHINQENCYCNDDLCNTGNWNRELSYLLMGITIGFQIVINCLVV